MFSLLAPLLFSAASLGSPTPDPAHLTADFDATPPEYLDSYRNKLGGVSTESALCSEIGISMLEKGGSAADAMGRAGSFLSSILLRPKAYLLTLSPSLVSIALC